jgi:hypothetical protein
MKKIIVSTILVGLLLTTPILPVYAMNFVQQKEGLKSVTIVSKDNFDRWAVIIGISEYYDVQDLETSARDAKHLYDLLQDKDGRWNTNNMQLLINETATKQNILNALDWLKEKAGENDIILFSFGGHGSDADDTNGDESDGMDEVICPYDCYRDETTGELINYITDDVLGLKFDEIGNKNVKGMYLIFDSCLSGGLVDWNGMTNGAEFLPVEKITEMSQILQESNILVNGTLSAGGSLTSEQILSVLNQLPQESLTSITELTSNEESLTIEEMMEEWNAAVQEANSFTTGLTEDISTDNKVILTCTLPRSLGVEFSRFINDEWIGFSTGLCKAIEKGKTSAEDISQYAMRWWLSQPMLYCWLSILILGEILWHHCFGDWLIFHNNTIVLPLPMLKDEYPANDPLSAELFIIGDSDDSIQSNSEANPSASPNQQKSVFSSQSSSLPGSTTQQSTTGSKTSK